MTAGVTGLSVAMATRPTASPTAQTLSAPANLASRRRDTTPVEVHLPRALHQTNNNSPQIHKCFGGKEVGCGIFLFNTTFYLALHFSDKNECVQFGVCSHVCNNTKGSYKCSCHKYFTRISDTCKADSENYNYIYVILCLSFSDSF